MSGHRATRARLTFLISTIAIGLSMLMASAVTGRAQDGSVSGRVTAGSSGQPLATARVNVVGTAIATQTNSDGRYVLRGLVAGTVSIRASRIGYGEQTQQVAVSTAQAAAANFTLRPVAVSLSGVVVTATGEQHRIEMGNAIAHLDAKDIIKSSVVTNMADLLTARAPGVMVIPGTQTGAGVRVRIRGTSSLSLTNNPIYIVDGIRIEGGTGSSSISVGGTTPSRINDLNPEEIESIEIVRGPSAATLYGTDAANGVIVISTKRGIAGKPQWTYYTEQTAITDRNDYPTAFRGWRTGTTSGTTSTALNTVQCFLSQVVAGTCKQDSVTSYNLVKDKESTPFGTGYRQQHGLQLRGGSDAARYFLHTEWQEENGRIKLPEFDKSYIASRGIVLSPEQSNPNHLGKTTTRANINVALPNNADIAISTGYISESLRLPRSDDSGTPGIAANIYGGPGFKYNVNAAGDTLYGWREFLPRQIYQAVTQQTINRLISSINANWRPQDWLALRSNLGLDYIGRKDTQLCAFEECTSTGDRMGFKTDNRSTFLVYSVDAGGTATRRISARFEAQTAIGVQYYQNVFNRNGAQGSQLSPGGITVQAGAVRTASEVNDESRTLGAYVEERLTINNRLFLTGAVRSDRNSAFGADFKTVFYPKLSASWLLSDESFFRVPGVRQLRLRSAYGASGVQPGTTDAVPFYSPTRTLGESGEAPGLLFQTLGNSTLKPERSTEFEAGVDASLWSDRVSVELTRYVKNSKDALINRPLPPSLGTGATARFENLGHVRNSGWEALVRTDIVRSSNIGWDLSLNGSINNNKIVKLGVPTIISSSTIRQVQGSPLNAWWARRLVSYEDKDGNGIITLGEIVVSDTAEYHGYAVPRYEATLTNGFELFKRRVRIAGLLDYKGGHLVYNNSERIRCASRFNCSALVNPASSLYEQARTVMVREHSSASAAGFFEKGDFIRFREMNVSFTVPEGTASRFLNSRSIVATVAARNIGMLWTKYTGVDPEAFGTTGDAPSSFQAFAPPTYFSFRLTLGL